MNDVNENIDFYRVFIDKTKFDHPSYLPFPFNWGISSFVTFMSSAQKCLHGPASAAQMRIKWFLRTVFLFRRKKLKKRCIAVLQEDFVLTKNIRFNWSNDDVRQKSDNLIFIEIELSILRYYPSFFLHAEFTHISAKIIQHFTFLWNLLVDCLKIINMELSPFASNVDKFVKYIHSKFFKLKFIKKSRRPLDTTLPLDDC
jgi:hypothetical protein